MRGLLLLGVFTASCLVVAAADPPAGPAKLQGVWHSPADAKVPVRVIVLGDKVGYMIGDVAANPPVPGASFVGLTRAKFAEAGDKQQAELMIAKDYTRKVEFRVEKDGLVLGVDKAEHPLRRANTRDGDPAAKPLAGTWTIAEVGAKGMSAPGKDAGLESLSFAGDRYVLKGVGGKELLNSYYRAGAAKDGRVELDVFGLKADPTITALVEVKGEALTLAQPLRPGGPRPAGFDTVVADIFLIRATRAK
ncbi:MAG TPA: hypothetical protein VH092_14545 [Urbifossiella sp.]|jgi:hypothetical protein|nr:hypothetical protein [Urbifossiella sp.]